MWLAVSFIWKKVCDLCEKLRLTVGGKKPDQSESAPRRFCSTELFPDAKGGLPSPTVATPTSQTWRHAERPVARATTLDSQGLIGRRCRPATSSLLFSRRSLHLFTFFHSLFSSPHPFIISLVIARFHATFSQTSYSSSIHQTSLHLHISPLPSFSSVHLSFLRAVSYNQSALC